MNPHPSLPTRLKASSPGLGYPSQIEIETRAAELALNDGRAEFTDADVDRATTELSGGRADPTAPEADPALEELTAMDDSLDENESPPAPIQQTEDPNPAEVLIEDGLDEADHDTRVAAADQEDT